MDLTNEEVAVTSVNLCVGNVDHVLVDVKINLRFGLKFPLKCGCAFRPDNVHHLVLEAEQMAFQFVDCGAHVARAFLQRH